MLSQPATLSAARVQPRDNRGHVPSVANTTRPGTRLTCRNGRLSVHGWPAQQRAPFGLLDLGTHHEGPARLRWRVRQALEAAGCAYRDETPVPAAPLPCPSRWDVTDPFVGPALLAFGVAGHRGIVAGLPDASRARLAAALCARFAGEALVLAPDSAAAHRWQRQLPAGARAIAAGAPEVHWLGARHDLLVVDAPEAMPWPVLARALDASAALARVGLVARTDWRLAERLAPGLGPVLHVIDEPAPPVCHELRVPLPPAAAAAYADAFCTFLAAFDRFAAARPKAGFGTFVAQARGDPQQRPALSAWHAAIRLAAWHEHKAAVVGELLARHRRDRLLVFTPDRAAAYELAREHLIAAVTAELPRAERNALLDGFANGALRALAGPRLLDHGAEEGSADVAILVGGGFGAAQRRARCRRVAGNGVVYELVSLDTVEVGRARRWRAAPAHGEPAVGKAVVHGR